MNKQLFFCFGPPKSGTTFLQRILNLHPEVSCPSEHQFDFLSNNIGELLKQYDNILKIVDHRTGGQGTTALRTVLRPKIFQYTVENMIWESAKGKRIAGANDNAIITKIDTYNILFNSPKFIVIFRNPIDTAISAWHHNMELAKEENNPGHKLFMTMHGDLEDWIKYIANNFSHNVHAYMNFNKSHDNIIMVRYEDLKNDKEATIIRLFDFLGASTSGHMLSCIIEESSLAAMKDASIRKEFFRSGSTEMGKVVISDDLRREVTTIATEALQLLGYDLTA